MAQEEECPKCPPEGLPAWMGTFADLMSLLMCFFVLLLAFSEMDVLKFKQIAGSMKFAFGVQNKIEVKDIWHQRTFLTYHNLTHILCFAVSVIVDRLIE